MCFVAGATAGSFLDRSSRRKEYVLFEWCSFNSATYVMGFCYAVVNFLRGAERRRISLGCDVGFVF